MIRGCKFAKWLVLALATTRTVAGQSRTTADPVNDFPISLDAEAFVNRPVRVSAHFLIYFGAGGDKYLPVSNELATILSADPVARSPATMRVRTVRTTCTPTEVVVPTVDGFATATGAMVETEVEVTPLVARGPTTRRVTLSFPLLDTIFGRLSRQLAVAKAEVHIDVRVWASERTKENARLEAERREQEQRQQEEAARREGEIKAEQDVMQEQREQDARDRVLWQERKRIATPIAFALLVVIVGVFLKRHWIWPDLWVELGRGQFKHLRSALPGQPGQIAEAGTILFTAWARSPLGRRHRIKVETFAPEAITAYRTVKPDVFVSTAKSIYLGHYLAELPNGVVHIKVKNQDSISIVG